MSGTFDKFDAANMSPLVVFLGNCLGFDLGYSVHTPSLLLGNADRLRRSYMASVCSPMHGRFHVMWVRSLS